MDKISSLDFDSHIPYYIQLMDILKDQVSKDKWHRGDRIPGEQDLCEMYGVSIQGRIYVL